MGDMVLQVVLDELGLLPPDRDTSPAKVLVTVFSEETLLASYQLSAELRQVGIPVTTYPTPEKLGKQFKYADRIGAQLGLILGPEEIQENTVALKDLATRDQTIYPRKTISQVIQDLLDKDSGA
jgi:histidyl-tRNA synthetase